jgi:flagellar basal-body rod protein FlgB
VDSIGALLITKALDGLALRQSAIADNIANANSPGHRPARVSFEEALKDAAGRGAAAVRAVTPHTEQAAPGAPGETRLDMELAAASATAMRYAALIDLLGRQMQISRTVVKGGQ